jgi:hypothetical protein
MIIAIVVFFLVKIYMRLMHVKHMGKDQCAACKESVKFGATKCPHCASSIVQRPTLAIKTT